MTSVSAFIVSDLHAVDDVNGAEGASHVRLSHRSDPSTNALAALRSFVVTEQLSADYLICPGDLTDRADGAALAYAWEELRALADSLGSTLVATTGNHDLDSRHASSGYDTLRALKALPDFPVAGYEAVNEFFARQFTIVDDERARVVIVDTCHFHRDSSDERDHGRISPEHLAELLSKLESLAPEPTKINIVLAHHHPLPWSRVSSASDEVRGGEPLVAALEDRVDDAWIFVHGHRHTPEISYLGTTSGGPVRLAAGSLGTALTSTNPATPNQAYLVELELGPLPGLAFGGTYRAWDWTTIWEPAAGECTVPHHGGFGFRANGRDLARWVGALGQPQLSWSHLEQAEPRLKYLAPVDLHAFVMALRNLGYGVDVNPENHRPEQITIQ